MSERDPFPYATPAGKAYPQSFGRQAFGVIVRTVGLLLAIYGGHELLVPVLGLVGMEFYSGLPGSQQFVQGAFCTTIGVLLVVKGGWVVNLSYRRDE